MSRVKGLQKGIAHTLVLKRLSAFVAQEVERECLILLNLLGSFLTLEGEGLCLREGLSPGDVFENAHDPLLRKNDDEVSRGYEERRA